MEFPGQLSLEINTHPFGSWLLCHGHKFGRRSVLSGLPVRIDRDLSCLHLRRGHLRLLDLVELLAIGACQFVARLDGLDLTDRALRMALDRVQRGRVGRFLALLKLEYLAGRIEVVADGLTPERELVADVAWQVQQRAIARQPVERIQPT